MQLLRISSLLITQYLKKVGVVWTGHVPPRTAVHISSWVLVFVSMTRLRRASLSVLHFHAFCGYRTCVVSHRTITCSHAISTIRYSISSIHLFLCECVPSLYQQYTTHHSHHTETPHTVPSQCCSLFGSLYIHIVYTHVQGDLDTIPSSSPLCLCPHVYTVIPVRL